MTSPINPAASADANKLPRINAHPLDSRFHLIGGGIASMAAAAYLIRDAGVAGCNITIYEAARTMGGSLDGSGSPAGGYMLRGGRMFESKYRCTFDLFSSIPTLDGTRSVTREIFDSNETLATDSKCRLVIDGRRIDSPDFRLRESDILTLERIGLESENTLGDSRISDHFDHTFFESNFWLMWATTFAFQPWHSAVEFRRYLLRFAHMVPGFNRLHGILRTVFNQYDSMVLPLQKWLQEHGVQFELGAPVSDLIADEGPGPKRITAIVYERTGAPRLRYLSGQDYAIVTLGSMTESSTFGSMDRPAQQALSATLGAGQRAWPLWQRLAAGRPEFGRPDRFCTHVDESKWLSFTITLKDPTFFRMVRDFTGNVPGEGGLVTFAQSNWLASIVLPHQPHFIGQPADTEVCWGYGLFVDRPGNFIKKPMAQCSGREIMIEILNHLRIAPDTPNTLDAATCIPCMMPFITSQFLARSPGDRPQVVPAGWTNLAFVGQFVEIPDDVVFTVEYSVRAAQTAVYSLLGLPGKPPGVYKGQHDPLVLYKAFKALHDM